jgi:hypothetical protein
MAPPTTPPEHHRHHLTTGKVDMGHKVEVEAVEWDIQSLKNMEERPTRPW